MRPLLAIAILFLVASGQTALAQSSATCQRTANNLKPEQRGLLAAWIKNDANGADLTVDHLCLVDAARAVVALVDFRGLASAVYIATFTETAVRVRKILDGTIEAPALMRPPAGGLFLLFAAQGGGRGTLQRRVVLLNLDTGAEQVMATGAIATGCGQDGKVVRLYPRVTDVNNDRQPDIVIERETLPCGQDKPVRSQENFLADGPGYRKP